jgi:hypothetical protein
LGNIDAGVDVLEACVGSNKVNVNISSGNISGFATQTTLASILSKNSEIETSANAIQAAVEGTLTVGLSATDNAVLDAIAADGDAIQTKLDTIETTNNACQVLLGTIDSDTDAIKTSTAACATDLAALEVLSTAANVDLAAIEVLITTSNTGLSSIDSALTDIDGLISDNKDLLTAIDSDTDAIKTATELVATAVDTNSSNATAVRSDVYFEGVASETNSGNKNANCQRVVLATDDVNSAAINTATSACATDLAALEVLSTAANVDLAAMEVLLTAANVDHAANEVLLTAIAADGDAVQTKLDTLASKLDVLETTLTEIAPRRTAVELLDNSTLNAWGATATVDTLGFSFMTIHARQTSANLQIDIQVRIGSTEDFFNSPTDKIVFETRNGGNWGKFVMEHPSRYVRFVNQNGGNITGLYLDYTLSN